MNFVLTVVGALLLLVSVGGISFGLFMASDPRTRDSGRLFAVWWVPAAGASGGVLLRDPVTFLVGLLCFLVAGAVFTAGGGGTHKPTVKRKTSRRGTPGSGPSEETTRENKTGGSRSYRRAAS